MGGKINSDNTQEIALKENINVIEANSLILSNQDELTLSQARFLRLAIAQIMKDDTDLRTYTCSLSELAKFFGSEKGHIAREIYETIELPNGQKKFKFLNGLLKKTVNIPSIDKKTGNIKINPKTRVPYYKEFQWVTTAEYCPDESEETEEKETKTNYSGKIKIKLNDELKPYLLGLKKYYTGYGYTVLLKLPSYNAIRLYEILMSYANMANKEYDKECILYDKYGKKIATIHNNERPFIIDDLRVYLNCSEKDKYTGEYIKYPSNSDFLRCVIKKNLKLFYDKALLNVDIRTAKEDGVLKYVIFTFNPLTAEQQAQQEKELKEAREKEKRLNNGRQIDN